MKPLVDATSTPLSSIFGSGFLIIVPILAGAVGSYAVLAMAAVYLAVGAIPDPETALYFSIVTFTTLGYGDVTLDTGWRLLASFQAANGTIMFGWTTAIVMAVIHRIVAERTAVAT